MQKTFEWREYNIFAIMFFLFFPPLTYVLDLSIYLEACIKLALTLESTFLSLFFALFHMCLVIAGSWYTIILALNICLLVPD